jgi:hypothetical protein
MFFKIAVKNLWVRGDDPAFNDTEIGGLPAGQREKLRFLLAPLTRELRDSAREANTTIEKPARRGAEPVERFDIEGFALDLFRRVVVDWEGVLDEDGKPIACTPDNKDALATLYQKLGAALGTVAGEVMERHLQEVNAAEEDAEKNSGSSPDGSADGGRT